MSAIEKDCCDSVTTIEPRSVMNDVPEKSALLIHEEGESRLLVTHKEFLSVRRERE